MAGSISPPPEKLAWVYAPVSGEGDLRYVLGAGIEPQAFQELLTAVAGTRHNRGRGRSARHSSSPAPSTSKQRVGTPATEFVRKAIQEGDSGFYPGTTYEGLKNYTAFHTSAWSQWSAHLAVASTAIDAPTTWSFVAAALAVLGILVLGGILVLLDGTRHGRTTPRRRNIAPVAEDGGGGPADRRHRARLQQSAHGRDRQPRFDSHASQGQRTAAPARG